VNGLEHVVSGTLRHLAAAFACNTCGGKGNSKSGLFHGGSKSKGCGCSGSSKVAPSATSDPFKDDEVQGVETPDMEARIRTERRAVHRPVFRTRTTARLVRSEPRTLSIATAAQPLTLGKPTLAPVLRPISAESRTSLLPHNPLR
jgi:hypothetical protein